MSNRITIKTEYKIDPQLWNDFVNCAEGGTFFSFIDYYEIIKADIFIVSAYNMNNELVGGIICRIREASFPFNLLSKSLWIESGILINAHEGESGLNIKNNLIANIEIEARKLNCISINFNHWCREKDPAVFTNNNYLAIDNPTFVLDLNGEEKEIFSLLSKGHKSAVKKAIQNNVDIQFHREYNSDLIDKFYLLYKSTQERAIAQNANTSMTLRSKEFFNKILNSPGLPIYLVCAYYSDELAAAAVLVEKGDTMIYFIGASEIELNRKYSASNLLLWKSAMWAKEKGIKKFDFGGVPFNPSIDNPAYGVYSFKKNFGGELINYYSGEKILSPGRAKIFSYIMKNRRLVRTVLKIIKKN